MKLTDRSAKWIEAVVAVRALDEVDQELIAWLRRAYERAK